MSTLTIEVDGEFAALRGTTKGDAAQRAAIRRPWTWGGRTGAWVLPRNLRPETRAYAIRTVKAALEAAGYVVEVEDTGVRQTEAERREAAAERLEQRADRYDERAARRAAESDARYATVRRIGDMIPMGQPILVGHHSEGRHRRDIERMHSNMTKSVEAQREAERLAERAEGLRRELVGTPLVTLRRRIERLRVEVRDYDRKLDDAIGGGRRGLLRDLRQRAQEALDLDQAELERRAEEDGVRVWTREDFVKGDEVMDRYGEWQPVIRVNAKTVTVPHGIDGLRAAGHTWTRQYAEIRGRRRNGEVILTRAATKPAEEPTEELVAHEVVLADGDYLKLQATCQACGRLAYWRLGTAVWEHADAASPDAELAD